MRPAAAKPLINRTVLITGATGGIGRATAEAVARMGASVIIHGRDPERVDTTRRIVSHSANHDRVYGAVADLASLTEVRRLAAEVHDQHDRLDVLINNAGLVTRKRCESADGFELQLAVNHLAPFLLTHLLLDKLETSAPARVVNVASMAHHRAAFDLTDLNWEKRRYSGIGAYGATKLANILFTRALARRMDRFKVTANSLHPGVVATNIFSGMGVLGSLFGLLSKPLLLSANDGAATSIHLTASPELAGVSGEFFKLSQPEEPSDAARDDASAELLWASSASMTGLEPRPA
jgi:retinol dehydrogenase-12